MVCPLGKLQLQVAVFNRQRNKPLMKMFITTMVLTMFEERPKRSRPLRYDRPV